MTLSGSDTAADYQAALRSVTYSFAGNGDPTAGGHQQTFVTWQVSDGNAADVLPTPINNDQPTLGLNELVVMYGLFPAYDSDNGTSDGGGIPLGAIRTFAGGTVWGGTAAADGQVLSLQQNTALFSGWGRTMAATQHKFRACRTCRPGSPSVSSKTRARALSWARQPVPTRSR